MGDCYLFNSYSKFALPWKVLNLDNKIPIIYNYYSVTNSINM